MKVIQAIWKFMEAITEGRRMRIDREVKQYINTHRK